MKLEIEVTEDVLQSALEKQVRDAVIAKVNEWGAERRIKECIDAMWSDAVASLVTEALSDSARLKTLLAAELEKKLRSQLAAAIKAGA